MDEVLKACDWIVKKILKQIDHYKMEAINISECLFSDDC